MRLVLNVLFSFFCCLTIGLSQGDIAVDSLEEEFEPTRVNFYEGAFSVVVPRGSFKEEINRSTLLGFSLSYLKQIKIEQPAFFGVELYGSFMGSLSRNYEQSIDGEFIELTGTMRSNIIGLNLIGRYYPSLKFGPIEPFFEFHFGPKLLYSQLSEAGVFSDQESYTNTDFLKGDVVLGYGGAVGIQVFLNDHIYLVIKSSYQVTNSGEYYKRIDDDYNIFPLLPIDGFEMANSITDNLKFDIGFTFLY